MLPGATARRSWLVAHRWDRANVAAILAWANRINLKVSDLFFVAVAFQLFWLVRVSASDFLCLSSFLLSNETQTLQNVRCSEAAKSRSESSLSNRLSWRPVVFSNCEQFSGLFEVLPVDQSGCKIAKIFVNFIRSYGLWIANLIKNLWESPEMLQFWVLTRS